MRARSCPSCGSVGTPRAECLDPWHGPLLTDQIMNAEHGRLAERQRIMAGWTPGQVMHLIWEEAFWGAHNVNPQQVEHAWHRDGYDQARNAWEALGRMFLVVDEQERT